jgi:hypothetical protein
MICGGNYFIIFFEYYTMQIIIWDPQIQNGGWVGAWVTCTFNDFILLSFACDLATFGNHFEFKLQAAISQWVLQLLT